MGAKPTDLKERELCEEHEMESCFAVAKDKCIGFARDKCLNPFRDARIAVKETGLTSKDAVKLIFWASLPARSSWVMSQMGSSCLSYSNKLGVINYRASELLGSDDLVQRILGDQPSSDK